MLLNYWKSCTQELGQGEGAGLVGFHLFFAKHTLEGPSSPLYLGAQLQVLGPCPQIMVL